MTAISPPASPPAGNGPTSGRPSGHMRVTPGRGVALVLGVPVVLALVAALGFSFVQDAGQGSFPVSYTFPVRQGGLALSLPGGDVTIRSGIAPIGEALVHGTVHYKLARPAVRPGPGTLGIECPAIDTGNCWMNGTVDVNAPGRTHLTIETGGGNLTATGLTGPDTFSTDGGTLGISGETGDLSAQTGGGDVTASQDSGANVTLNSDGGDVSGTTWTTPQVAVSSGGGDVTLTFSKAPLSVHINSDGGNVKIVVPRTPHGYIVGENPDGGDTAGLRSTPGATNVITVDSGGGNIDVEYPTS